MLLRWLNRVMQDHEARASDLNQKFISSFFLFRFLRNETVLFSVQGVNYLHSEGNIQSE